MKKALFILFVLFYIKSISQNKKVDSLQLAFLKATKDTSKVNILNAIAWEFKSKDPDSSIYYAREALSLSHKIKFGAGEAESYLYIGTANASLGKKDDAILLLLRAKGLFEKLIIVQKKGSQHLKKNLARTYNSLGNVYSSIGNYPVSLKMYESALKIRKEIGDKLDEGSTYNNIAVVYKDLGRYSDALKYHFMSLHIKESFNNKSGMAISYNNIGNIYNKQGDQEQGIKFLKKSLKLAEELKMTELKTVCYLNIASIYSSQNRLDESIQNNMKALEIAEQNNDQQVISEVLGNLGLVYLYQGKYDEALKNELEALKIKKDIQDYSNITPLQNNISQIYFKKGDIKNAILYGEQALSIAKNTHALEEIKDYSENMYIIYKSTKNYQKAFEMQEFYIQALDSLQAENNEREIMREEFQYNYQKQAIADSLNYSNQKKISELENQGKFKIEKSKRITLYIGLILIISFALFIFNRFRVTNKQKNIIELQSKRLEQTHRQLEGKTKEIKDSILYSKEIQNTFLKSPTDSKNYFNDTVLLYKPKDVVSGDFYWYKEIDDKLFVVVGDSTGHGVPGAIISVLAIQSLEKTIHKIKDIENLHELNSLIRNEFNAYYNLNGHVSIGLDYSIICINRKNNRLYISGSGANILIKDNNELNSYKFDTINIGGSLPVIYEPKTVILDLKTVRSVFLYTDGIIDQRGAATGKKFGTKKLKELILNLNTNDSDVAAKKIEEEINNWIGLVEQIDDITLLGIQIHHV